MQQRTLSFDFFRELDGMLAWLEQHRLTLEDAERTMQEAAAMTGFGAGPDEIVRHFLTTYSIPMEEYYRAEQLAALFAFRRRLHRIHGGRFTAPRVRPKFIVMCRVDADELEAVAPYAHRGTAILPERE